MQELCILASPRTGINHVATVLSSCRKIKLRAEIFHPNRCHNLSPEEVRLVGNIANRNFTSHLDHDLVSFVRSNPEVLLDVLDTIDRARVAHSFKLFPDHLSFDKIEHNIVRRPNIHFIFVLRHPVDSFISNVKAKMLGQHLGVDTTQLRVRLDPIQFAHAVRHWRMWYEKTSALVAASGRPSSVLYCETDINHPTPECYEHIRAAAVRCGISPSAFTPPLARLVGLERQD